MTLPHRLRRALAVALAAVALVTASCGDDGAPTGLAGIVREPLPDVSAVALPSASGDGAPLSVRAEPGGISVVYFGYLSCPDVCPTTMADLRTALGGLPEADRAKVTVTMVTIDPGRDSASSLAAYVRGFVGDAGRAARTDDDAQLRAAASAFGADYAVTKAADGTVEVSHTAYVYLVDDQGRLRLTWPFGIKPPDMKNDLTQLLRAAPRGA